MRGFLLFDIDGVIRDVANSYRLAIQDTVHHFSDWRPTIANIDELKSEGCWNNDWDATQELLRRNRVKKGISHPIPEKEKIIEVFNSFYFGGAPQGSPIHWNGYIKNERLLVKKDFFEQLTLHKFGWGFISGAELPSAKFVLETRLGLSNPPLIAMGDAPEKPNPKGLLDMGRELVGRPLGLGVPNIAYIGDTVADVLTIQNAKEEVPEQKFLSFAIAPPHLQKESDNSQLFKYEKKLKDAGADEILKSIEEVLENALRW